MRDDSPSFGSERFWFLLAVVGAFGVQFVAALGRWTYPASDYIAYAFIARHGEADLAHYPLYVASLRLLDSGLSSTVDAFYLQAFFWTGLAAIATYLLARRRASAPAAFAITAFVAPFLLVYARESHYLPQFLAYAMLLTRGNSDRPIVRHAVFAVLLVFLFLRLDLLLPLLLYGTYLIITNLCDARESRKLYVSAAALLVVLAGAISVAGPAYQARSRVAFSQHLWIAEHARQKLPDPPGEYEPYVREHFGEPLVSPTTALQERPALFLAHVSGNVSAFFRETRDFFRLREGLTAWTFALLGIAGFVTLLVRLTTGGLRISLRKMIPLLIPLVHVVSVLLLYPRDVFFAGLLPWLVLGFAVVMAAVPRLLQRLLVLLLLLTAAVAFVQQLREPPPQRSVIATMRALEDPAVCRNDAPAPRIVSDFDTRLVCLMLRVRECEIVTVDAYLADPATANLMYYSGLTPALREHVTLTDDHRILNMPLGFFLETGRERFFQSEAFAADPYSRRDRQRLADLETIAAALEAYRKKHDAYPGTGGAWFARRNCAGPSREDWIPGLAPEFIVRLPQDPRADEACDHQYVYKSDGTDFKILALGPEAAGLWLQREEHRDTKWPAYSAHSPGAREW